jgi:hypothetical protein
MEVDKRGFLLIRMEKPRYIRRVKVPACRSPFGRKSLDKEQAKGSKFAGQLGLLILVTRWEFHCGFPPSRLEQRLVCDYTKLLVGSHNPFLMHPLARKTERLLYSHKH